MRRSETQHIGQILEDLLSEFQIGRKIKEARILNAWDEVVGSYIRSHTVKTYIRNRILFVEFDSAVIRNEVFMMKEQLTSRLNDAAGGHVIEKIVFR